MLQVQTLKRVAAFMLLGLALVGCGQKGALYFPEDRPQEDERARKASALIEDSKTTKSEE